MELQLTLNDHYQYHRQNTILLTIQIQIISFLQENSQLLCNYVIITIHLVYSQFFNIVKQMSKINLNQKELKINPQLKYAIRDCLQKDPKLSREKIVEMIVESKKLRLPLGPIKSGVQAYFSSLGIREPETNNKGIKQNNSIQIVQVQEDNKPKKKVKKNQFIIEFQDRYDYRFQNLGGVREVVQKIREEIFNIIVRDQAVKAVSKLPPNKGFLLSGSPGSGKTVLANCILSYLVNHQKSISAYSVSSYELLSGDAQDKVKKLFEAAEESAPSIIFIDNLEELCNKENNKRMQSLPSLTLSSYICKSRDKNIYFLGATSAPEKMDQLSKPGMFYKQIKVNNPDDEQRKEIIEKVLAYYQNSVTENIKQLVLMTAGYVAIDIMTLFKQALVKCIARKTPQLSQTVITIEDFREAVKEVQPILKKDGFAKIPSVKLEDVGALHNIKEELTQQIIMPLRQQQKFKQMNFQVSGGGILLYGPPGCGKTMIAKAIANQANANFITVKGPQLLNKYVGESEQAVRKVFERARMSAPCIIFFDQFDALAPKRQDQGNQVTQRVVNTLLNELNGVDDRRMVFVIAATNRPDIIDEAVLRSGRIEKHLYVPLPNQEERLQILRKIAKKVKSDENLQLEEIAKHTDNFSGADLFFLIKKSVLSAISASKQRIDANDVKQALSTFKKDKYSKGNKLRLTQLKEESSESGIEDDVNLLEDERSPSVKKTRSVMQVEHVGLETKKRKKQSIFDQFLSYLLQNRVKNDKKQLK